MVIMRRTNAQISAWQLDNLERRTGLRLPNAYRAFLLQTNGGRPEAATFPIQGLSNNPDDDLDVLFGVDAAVASEDLERTLGELPSTVPHGVLPIGSTAGDDFVCLDLRADGEKVIYWDRRPFWGENIWRETDLYPVAMDFESFLLSLKKSD